MNFIKEKNRIYMEEGGKLLAEVVFDTLDKDTVSISRTFVDESLRGQGIAGQLLRAAYKEIKSQNKKAIPTCSYAVKWFVVNKEYRDIIRNG